jgi:glycerol-3-phosphate dehydrogenase (NAD(P)+)
LAERIQKLFQTDYFRVYTQPDMIGAELGGALKNVYAIACGISDGLALGDNSKAAIMTRGLNEMARIGVEVGAQSGTFYGLSGMGDLIVTCLSKHSRNRLLGEKLGQGKSVSKALSEMTMVAEGYKNTRCAHRLAADQKIQCPLIREIYAVLYENKDPRRSLQDLMARQTHVE